MSGEETFRVLYTIVSDDDVCAAHWKRQYHAIKHELDVSQTTYTFSLRERLATISVTIFNVPSITIAEINHDIFVEYRICRL